MRKNNKWIAICLALLTVLLLASCGSKKESATEATETSQTTEAPTSTGEEPASEPEAFRAAYAQKLAALRAKFGTPKGEYSVQKKGVLFADLLDWDQDGTPELITITHEGVVNDQDTFRFAAWGTQDGAAVSLFDSVVGPSYGSLGSDLSVYVTQNSDGTLMLCVDDGGEFASLKETYYTLSAGKVSSTVLSAQSSVGGWSEDGDPVDPDAYQIDGTACSKTDFDARRKAFGRDGCLSVYCQNVYDTGALDLFLTGQSDVYSAGALQQAASFLDESVPQWLPNVMFHAGEDTAPTAAEYKAAYAAVISSIESKVGPWVSEDKDGWEGTGIMFCDLFDWDQDGDPELFVAYTEEQHPQSEADILRLTDLEVYTFEANEAKRILHGKPGHDYMETSSFQSLRLLQDEDGSVVLCVPHSENIWDNETLMYYRYRDGKVTSSELYAKAENYDEDSQVPPTLNLFKIDGKKVEEAKYNAAKLDADENKVVNIMCNQYDYDALKAFLNGKTDSYACALLTSINFHIDFPSSVPADTKVDLPEWAANLTTEF